MAQTLDGGWLRRERRWIAMGRKPLALRLGITEHKLTMLELRCQDVPRVVAESPCGAGVSGSARGSRTDSPNVCSLRRKRLLQSLWRPFHSPILSVSQRTLFAKRSETSVSEVPPIEVVVEIDSAMSAETCAPVLAAPMEQAGTLSVEELPCLHAHVTEESGISGLEYNNLGRCTDPGDGTPTRIPTGNAVDSALWSMAARAASAKFTREVVKRLGMLPMDLNAVERLNILCHWRGFRAPSLGAITEAEAARRLSRSKSSMKNGRWLRKQRGRCGLTHAAVAAWLGVSRSDVKLVEARWAPLPIEWLPRSRNCLPPTRQTEEAPPR